jgi:F-type H+-transporting ATPase subunit delta
VEKGYFKAFSDCVDAYKSCYNHDHKILEVKATAAVALTQAQQQRLTEKLSSITGKTVELTCVVDPRCLGGMRLDYDGRRVEDTLRQRLDTLGDLLKNTAI